MTTSPMTRMTRRILMAATIGGIAACVGPGLTEPTTRDVRALRELSSLVNLVECPTTEFTSSTATVTPLGGVVSAGGTSVSIPPGALLLPTTITVTVPTSNYMEIDVSVEGLEHFTFQQPVTLTLSYERCNRSNIDKAPLSVWYIDSDTKAPLELMTGVDDKIARAYIFSTDHLSGYALAN